ncbi:MAG: aminopeptidase N [Carbonactinosporaceae bacterium]
MPGMNLTREEARERARLLTVDSYEVALDLTASETTFPSTTVIRFSCSEPGTATFVDLAAHQVHEITLNGKAVDPATAYDGARVTLESLAADNELRLVADCTFMKTGEGLHRFVDPVDGKVYLYSQFEVADARRVYACFDQPDLKATFGLTVRAPGDWLVVSNAPAPAPDAAEPAGKGGGRGKGARDAAAVWRFPPTKPISTYITAVVAGPYHEVRDEHRGIPLGVYCRASLADHLDADEIFEVTKQGFDYYLETFDHPYPFEKYDQLFVPEFNAGAMENAGCVTIVEDYVFRSRVTDAAYEQRAETILHELAHMWFGNLVTMRWWDDLWLNESFATYASVLCQSEATRWGAAWTTFATTMKTWAYRQDQLPSTHPIVADIRDLEDVEVNFDGITYAKGAAALKQLVHWVGLEEFFHGVRAYFKRHAWGNSTLQDLLVALEETSGRDLTEWSRLWLETAGINTLRPEITTGDDGTISDFTVVQEAPESWPTLRPHRIAIGCYDRTPAGLTRVQRVETDVAGARTPVPELTGKARPDLVLLNDDDLTFAKIRLDANSLETLTGRIGEFTESLPRTLCWVAEWDMTRDAELSARDYLQLVLGGIDTERDVGVVQALLRQARTALDFYASPEFRSDGLLRLAEAAQDHMRGAEPGSDHQLAWARTFAGTATTGEHLAVLRRLLDGDERVEGLTVDTDLRWTFLQRLVVQGTADEPDIDAELDRDGTAMGQRNAAACLAARPTLQAKEEAWTSVVDRDDLPNAIQAAVISGFVQPDQRRLLASFVDRYFDSIKQVWATRTNEMAQQIVVGLYPRLLVSESTLERTDAFLAAEDPPPALRRLVLEGRDGVVRALRGRACDAAAAVSRRVSP